MQRVCAQASVFDPAGPCGRQRKRLGWQQGILNGTDLKPNGRHQSTCMRLLAQHDVFEGLSLAGMTKRLGLLLAGLEGLEAEMVSWR